MPARPSRHRHTSVVHAYIRPADNPGRFTDSVSQTLLYDGYHHRYLVDPPGGVMSMQSSPRVAEARSQVIDEFLNPDSPYAGAEWLWWTDADATFEKDTLARMMEHAHAQDVPILGALAFGGASPDTMFPTVYRLLPPENGEGWGMDRVDDYPRDTLVKVGATGCHCVLVHRQVFVAMSAKFGRLPDGRHNPYPWYAEGTVNRAGSPIGEDVNFCIKAQALGIPVHVHTGIKTGHVKDIVLDEQLWDDWREMKALRAARAQPATLHKIDGRTGEMSLVGAIAATDKPQEWVLP